jgi:hypothetical protein
MTTYPIPIAAQDATFTVASFPGRAARTKTEHAFSFGDLAGLIKARDGTEQGKLPWLKLARFGDAASDKDALWHNANAPSVSGVGYDDERVTFEQLMNLLRNQGVRAILTSPSHTEDHPRCASGCCSDGPLAFFATIKIVKVLLHNA